MNSPDGSQPDHTPCGCDPDMSGIMLNLSDGPELVCQGCGHRTLITRENLSLIDPVWHGLVNLFLGEKS